MNTVAYSQPQQKTIIAIGVKQQTMFYPAQPKTITKKRFQPYSHNNNNRNNYIEQQQQQSNSIGETDSLFGPIPTSASSSVNSVMTMFEGVDVDEDRATATDINSNLLLRDNELFAEFDDFMYLNSSNTERYLTSPPPSPTLTFQDLSGNNDDIGFDDFPLFP
ncbi:hypothetical protein BDF20DRAFT_837390 [Mycotypha africana]|uniref:uncharacterized protein n=1 Tax=Mycotypha africana TaxID=64632 RepID=UPI00230059ED|nr:uncharacterized protein BDF20DRAFT_837390 [Mycotypha africana]KAI8973445.1 hypothetical protein BDF20DRAFT_837390 [Mycotypha africana]